MQLERILIAVDGSPASRSAAEVGLEIAGARRASVIFMHVSPTARDVYSVASPEEGPTQEEIAAGDPVLREAADSAASRGSECMLVLTGGHGPEEIADEIVGTAAGLDAGMIVVGTRGRGDVASAVLGSVSHAVLKIAQIPVVVVHAGTPSG